MTALLMSLALACGDDDENGSGDGVTPTAEAPATEPAAPSPSAVPTGDTGIDIVDRAIEAVRAEDVDPLVALIVTEQVPCDEEAGVGGAPPCSGAPGQPPAGTPVEVFPYLTCEREWQFDLHLFAQRFHEAAGELYAVARLDTTFGEPPPEHLPPGGYAIVFTPADPSFETAHALLLDDRGIVAADSLCGGAPADFLADGPPLFGPALILEGPAFP